jgi:hypothetical protein
MEAAARSGLRREVVVMARWRGLGWIVAAAGLAAVLGGCSNPQVGEAPTDTGVCWRVTQFKPKLSFISVSQGDPNLESCAMHLEYTRQTRHLKAIAGAYQGEFLFVDAQDIASAQDLTSPRYSLFTANQRQDLEGKIKELIQRQPAGPAPAKGT